MALRISRTKRERIVRTIMWDGAFYRAGLAFVMLCIMAMVNPASAQEAGWQTFTREALGLSIQRPADLYELEPEAPAEDVTGEVEWGPKDHGWSIIVTSQKLKAGQTLATVVAEE